MHALSKSTAVEAKLFLREPLTVAFTLALPLLFLFVMGGVFGNKPDPQYYRGAGALDYYVPAYCGLVWAAVGLLALPVHLAHYREDGVLRRLRASAARPWVVLGAQLLVTSLISLAGSVLMIAMAALVYDIHAPRSLAGFLGSWLLCGMLFCALGVLLASIPSSRGALSAGLGLFFTMMMLSGAGPPPEVLTGAMHWVSNLLPLTYMLRLLQDPWLGLSWSLTDTAVVAAFIIGAVLSARLLSAGTDGRGAPRCRSVPGMTVCVRARTAVAGTGIKGPASAGDFALITTGSVRTARGASTAGGTVTKQAGKPVTVGHGPQAIVFSRAARRPSSSKRLAAPWK